MITPEIDKPCRDLGTYLMEQLNDRDTRIVVAAVKDHYPFLGVELPIESPLLCVFRGGSSGVALQVSELFIGYYLFDLGAYWEQPGILRWVEKAIVELLEPYKEMQPCLGLDLSELRSRRDYLPYGGLLLPFTVLSLMCTDCESIR